MSIVRDWRARRLESWLWTGPLGHLLGGALDFACALTRYLISRARRSSARGSLARSLSAEAGELTEVQAYAARQHQHGSDLALDPVHGGGAERDLTLPSLRT